MKLHMPALRHGIAVLAAACLLGIGAAAQADDAAYPTRTIDLYTPFPGYNDAMARLIVKKMSEELKQPFVVQNLPGAAGAIAAVKVKSAPADGYTLLFGSNGMFTINTLFNKGLGYQPSEFAPITMAYSDPTLLLVNPSLPVRNVKELLDYARANPGKITFGSSGVGTITHLTGEMLKYMSHTDMRHVPYKGTAQALTDLIGGRISMLFFPPQDAMQYIKTGQVRVLAISSKERSRSLPDVPTLDESGLPGYDLRVWYGFFAPARTPKPIVDKLQQAAAHAVQALDLQSRDLDPGGMPPADFAKQIERESQDLQKLVTEAHLAD
jgi:tripartite-type tricarboxylate transporter receptor subunit TctC